MKFSKTEIDAIIAASPRTFVPFNKLALSEESQARTAGSTRTMSIAELAASIKESGVLQNLIVVPADKALMASLAENCFHIPMHPADEYTAFAKLIEHGKSVEDVAAAFGVTPLVVKRRMKLAAVSPKLMAQFREAHIGLDCLMVLASVDDHQKQEQVWAALPTWNRRPDYLRQMLTQGEIESDRDPVAQYVTLKVYEKAGGALRRDLFSDDDKKAYLLDTTLLEKLATDKLQKRAKQIMAEGWKWVDVRVRYVFDEYVKYGELRKSKRQPNAQEAAALENLNNRSAVLNEQMEALADEDGDEDVFCTLESEAEGLEEQRKVLEETLIVWPSDLMTQAGCVVYVGNNGTVAVKYGLIRPEDRSDMVHAARQAGEEGSGDPLVSLPSPKTRPVHSEKLMRCLTAHRVAAVQAELIERPDVALAAITAHLAQTIFRGKRSLLLPLGKRLCHYGDRQPIRSAIRRRGCGEQCRLGEGADRTRRLGRAVAGEFGRLFPVAAHAGSGDGVTTADVRRLRHCHRHLRHRTGSAEQRPAGGGLGTGYGHVVDRHRVLVLQSRLKEPHPRGRH